MASYESTARPAFRAIRWFPVGRLELDGTRRKPYLVGVPPERARSGGDRAAAGCLASVQRRIHNTPEEEVTVALFCKRTFTGLAGLAVVATGFACGKDDPPDECVGPEAQGAMPDFEIIKGESLTRRIRQYFIDPNNTPEELEYSASTADESVAVVSKIDNLYDITVDGVEVGNTRITVTATDPCDKELTATQEAAVNVGHPNRPPFEPPPGIPDFVGENAFAVGEVRELELREWIRDPDGDVLTFTADTSDPSVVTCNIAEDTRLVITGVAPGLVTCTVTATDPDGLSVTADFQVEVVDDEG